MNKSILNLLRGGVFLVAVLAAFAFTAPQANEGLFGQAEGVWYDVTNITPGQSTYTCDIQENAECLEDAPHGEGSAVNPGEDRQFMKRGDLPEAQ